MCWGHLSLTSNLFLIWSFKQTYPCFLEAQHLLQHHTEGADSQYTLAKSCHVAVCVFHIFFHKLL